MITDDQGLKIENSVAMPLPNWPIGNESNIMVVSVLLLIG